MINKKIKDLFFHLYKILFFLKKKKNKIKEKKQKKGGNEHGIFDF